MCDGRTEERVVELLVTLGSEDASNRLRIHLVIFSKFELRVG